MVASTDEGTLSLAMSIQNTSVHNQLKVLNASHMVVLCIHTDMTEEHLGAIPSRKIMLTLSSPRRLEQCDTRTIIIT
ncbi:hypothetical protein ACFQDN_25090 [Pseudomonas asuensis]|uniref:Uncharacterized protein n=1 Tax=Pseudomonas asuensis TaxID=1825787 RepID=A0ABQ2GYD5_9PSED|nr:hypothetical protein [Pseudomonas asuensis]GGM19829.1 hypothetical protein GCM10009425_33360 [Pseudomonas asuensis]